MARVGTGFGNVGSAYFRILDDSDHEFDALGPPYWVPLYCTLLAYSN